MMYTNRCHYFQLHQSPSLFNLLAVLYKLWKATFKASKNNLVNSAFDCHFQHCYQVFQKKIQAQLNQVTKFGDVSVQKLQSTFTWTMQDQLVEVYCLPHSAQQPAYLDHSQHSGPMILSSQHSVMIPAVMMIGVQMCWQTSAVVMGGVGMLWRRGREMTRQISILWTLETIALESTSKINN